MTSTRGTAAGLGTFNLCTHKHTPHMAHGMSARAQGAAKCWMTIRKTPPSVTGYQESGHGYWGWEEKHQSPLCSPQKNPHLVTKYSYLGWMMCIFHMKRYMGDRCQSTRPTGWPMSIQDLSGGGDKPAKRWHSVQWLHCWLAAQIKF